MLNIARLVKTIYIWSFSILLLQKNKISEMNSTLCQEHSLKKIWGGEVRRPLRFVRAVVGRIFVGRVVMYPSLNCQERSQKTKKIGRC